MGAETDLLLAQNLAPTTQSDEKKHKADRIAARWGQLDTAAINWKTHWQLCYTNIVPRKEDVIAVRLPGDLRNEDLYDSTAIYACEMLAGALHGMLTNPETKFFEITFGDPRLDEDEEVKTWCQEVGDRMFRVLNNTNFQTEIYEIYVDLGAIGTACLYMGEHEENVVHFSARAMKEVRIDENSLGLIDVVYRCSKYRPYQIVQQFGKENCPYDILKMVEKDSQDQIEVLHAVEPMDITENPAEHDESGKNIKGHQFQSTYTLKNASWVLSEGGFREFPYAVPRWSKTTGETYGRGPGMAVLPDVMMLQAMMLTVIQGAQKTVDPPLMVEDDSVIGNVRLVPGGLSIIRPGSQMPKPLITDARIDFGQKMVEDVRNRIRAGFYIDQMQLAQGPQMTAEEVRQRTEERLRLMGPILGRQHFEFLKPVITRLFDIMVRKQLLPAAPTKIRGKSFDVRYSSMIARAQRMNEGQNITKAMQILQPLAQMMPSILDPIKVDNVTRNVFDICNLPRNFLMTEAELDKKRKQQQAAAQAAAKQQQEAHQADVAQKTAPMVSAIQDAKQQQQPNVS